MPSVDENLDFDEIRRGLTALTFAGCHRVDDPPIARRIRQSHAALTPAQHSLLEAQLNAFAGHLILLRGDIDGFSFTARPKGAAQEREARPAGPGCRSIA